MVADLNLISVNLATVCFESWLYGIFCVLFGTSSYLLIAQRREVNQGSGTGGHQRPVWRTPMFMAGCLITLSVTGHWILTIVRLFNAFINYMGGTEPLIAYADLSMRTEVAKTAFLVITVLISDAMIIYRLYIVWGYNKFIVIPPMLTWCGLIACGAGICYQFSVYTLGEDVFETAAGRWITSDCVFTFVTNVYCSLLIAFRVWRTTVAAPAYGGPNIMGALAIIIESAAIQTAWNLIFFVTYQVKSNLQFTAIDMWPAVCGISLTLINLRVALGWAQKAYPSRSRSGFSSGGQGRTTTAFTTTAEQSFAMHSIPGPITAKPSAERSSGSYDDHEAVFPTEKDVYTRQSQVGALAV